MSNHQAVMELLASRLVYVQPVTIAQQELSMVNRIHANLDSTILLKVLKNALGVLQESIVINLV